MDFICFVCVHNLAMLNTGISIFSFRKIQSSVETIDHFLTVFHPRQLLEWRCIDSMKFDSCPVAQKIPCKHPLGRDREKSGSESNKDTTKNNYFHRIGPNKSHTLKLMSTYARQTASSILIALHC